MRVSTTSGMRGTVAQFERVFRALADVNRRAGPTQVYLTSGALSAVATEMCLSARAGKMVDRYVRDKLEGLVFAGMSGGGGDEVLRRTHLAYIRFLEALGHSQATSKEEVLNEVNVIAAKIKEATGAAFAEFWNAAGGERDREIKAVYERIFKKFPTNVGEKWKETMGLSGW